MQNKIDIVVVGKLKTNCYIITNKSNECIIVDPGDEAKKIIREIGNKKVVAIFVTHSHFDHVGALEDIKVKYNVPINPKLIDNFSYEIISTPGHYFDSITFYFKEDKMMFVGDCVFKKAIGRTDMVGANNEDMINSLNKIKKYPGDTIIYPGHGEKTTIENEIDSINLNINYLYYNL